MTDDAARVALVAGGARGVGAAITTRLADAGWRVVVADRDRAPAGLPARAVVADVAGEAAVAALIAGITGLERRLDALICNAGVAVHKPLDQLALKDWQTIVGTNLTSTFLLARAAAPLLRASRGAIITVASTCDHTSEPATGSDAAAKGGLVALTQALALSLAPKVRAYCVSPCGIDPHADGPRPADLALHPWGWGGGPGDVAALVARLLAGEAGCVTGAELVADGGMTRNTTCTV